MNKLYEKYLTWKLNRTYSRISATQLFIKLHQNFDTSFDIGCVSRCYNKLDKLELKGKRLTNKLNYN